MNTEKEKKVFRIQCPGCQKVLWIDPVTQQVIRSEKGKRKKGSLDDLLVQEKKKREGFGRKFEATSEMQKERKEKAREIFEKALTSIDKENTD
ncbi:MAG: hypothetical protein JSV17_01875 [Candidatus Aminicenantes bacterium]|nr:MAG: hypothetical protein JSV17_01875 [Candidatus Aminicenantes bacterium]